MLILRQSLRELVRRMGDDRRSACSVDLHGKECQTRAIQLLKQNLSPAQREQYERRNHFDVTGGDTGRRYRIRHGVQMNVEQLDANRKRVRVLCFMPEGRLAVGDVMLAQKIALELLETEAVRIATSRQRWTPFWIWRSAGHLGSARLAIALSALDGSADVDGSVLPRCLANDEVIEYDNS
jgi:hypothetical protein